MNKKLIAIQQKLKAPKSQYNKFAKFSYRNAEDILLALKPLLLAEGLSLVLSDEVVNIGNANYIKATAILEDDEGETCTTTAFAREEETLKGQIAAQITGGASSYARKYALNGMFLIDDSEDPDSQDNRPKAQAPKANPGGQTDTTTTPKQDPLAVAKATLQKTLKSVGHDNETKMKEAINTVLGKTTVDTLQEANEVQQALDDGLI